MALWEYEKPMLDYCPLTGLRLKGRAYFRPTTTPPNILYVFEPIGSAILGLGALTTFRYAEQQGRLQPRTDLAGACREAKERGLEPYDINDRLVVGPDPTWPSTFEEKQRHFLQLFYDTGGRERKKRTINVSNDFPMAFAESSEQFHRILESLLDEGMICYDKSSRVSADFVNGIQILYNDVLLAPIGKKSLQSTSATQKESSKMTLSNSFHFGNDAKVNLIQGDRSVQTNVSGDSANVNVTYGNHNTQTNQTTQPTSLPELIQQIKQEFAAGVFDSYREEIEQELERIDLQLRKAEPKKDLLERAFDYLKDMAVKSAGPATAAAVVELLKHAPLLISTIGA